jgi:hypothetical protein
MPVTPLALKAFARMRQLARECTCDPTSERCGACREWQEWHRTLRTETKAKIWEYPCVIEPDDDNDDHKGNGRDNPAAVWERRARQRWRILDAALRAADAAADG